VVEPDNLVEKAAARYKTGRFQAALAGYTKQYEDDPHCSFEAKLHAALNAADAYDAGQNSDKPKRTT
jgi:hypothetical protein